MPLNLANLVRRVIKPHFEEVKWHPVWKGWHAFRRGLASTLYALHVEPKVIMAILRHSDIKTTLDFYVQVPDKDTREAVQKLENMFPQGL